MKTKQKVNNLPRDKTEIGTKGVSEPKAAKDKLWEAVKGNPKHQECEPSIPGPSHPSLT